MVAFESKTYEKPLTSGQTPGNRAFSGQSGYVIFLGEEPNSLNLPLSVLFPSYLRKKAQVTEFTLTMAELTASLNKPLLKAEESGRKVAVRI